MSLPRVPRSPHDVDWAGGYHFGHTYRLEDKMSATLCICGAGLSQDAVKHLRPCPYAAQEAKADEAPAVSRPRSRKRK